MNCCQCQGLEELFSEEYVAKEISNYRSHGPDKTTRMLIDMLKKQDIKDLTLLDIGGGVGAIQHEMLQAGAQHTTDIEASAAYLAAAKTESARRGFSERTNYQHGNFVDLAEHLQPADIVTLDRVICCYPDMEKMVGLSVARATRLYGLVYPRDVWWTKIGVVLANFFFRLKHNPYRAFIHSSEAVESIIIRNGFRRISYKRTLAWQVVLYMR